MYSAQFLVAHPSMPRTVSLLGSSVRLGNVSCRLLGSGSGSGSGFFLSHLGLLQQAWHGLSLPLCPTPTPSSIPGPAQPGELCLCGLTLSIQLWKRGQEPHAGHTLVFRALQCALVLVSCLSPHLLPRLSSADNHRFCWPYGIL